MQELSLSPDQQAVLDRFPPLLRALVLAELAAGNHIVHAGNAFPAPPAGSLITLARDLVTLQKENAGPLHFRERNSSMHHQEITDADAFFWIVTAPVADNSYPDMDAIREAHLRPLPPPRVERTYPPGSVEMDVRGESLIYHEADRRASINWFGGKILDRPSLTTWWYGVGGRQVTMTTEERTFVLDRILAHCLTHIDANTTVQD